MPSVARNLREVRRRIGLTQADLAKRLDVTQATVSRWEKVVDAQEPDLDMIVRIAEVAGVPPEELLEGAPYVPVSNLTGKKVAIMGAVSASSWNESFLWEKQDHVETMIPLIRGWEDAKLTGLIVLDKSGGAAYPFASYLFLYPYTSFNEPRDGDDAVIAEIDERQLWRLTARKIRVSDDRKMIFQPLVPDLPDLPVISIDWPQVITRYTDDGGRVSRSYHLHWPQETPVVLGHIVANLKVTDDDRLGPKQLDILF